MKRIYLTISVLVFFFGCSSQNTTSNRGYVISQTDEIPAEPHTLSSHEEGLNTD